MSLALDASLYNTLAAIILYHDHKILYALLYCVMVYFHYLKGKAGKENNSLWTIYTFVENYSSLRQLIEHHKHKIQDHAQSSINSN